MIFLAYAFTNFIFLFYTFSLFSTNDAKEDPTVKGSQSYPAGVVVLFAVFSMEWGAIHKALLLR